MTQQKNGSARIGGWQVTYGDVLPLNYHSDVTVVTGPTEQKGSTSACTGSIHAHFRNVGNAVAIA